MAATLLASLGLPEETIFARRNTILDKVPLGPETRNSKCGRGHYFCGMDVTKQKDRTYLLECWTVENATHTLMFAITADSNGEFIDGKVNCYGLGWQSADQEYLDIYLEEEPKKWNEIKWQSADQEYLDIYFEEPKKWDEMKS